MSSRKKQNKKKKSQDATIDRDDAQNREQSEKSNGREETKWLVKALYLTFGCFIVFFAWNAYAAITIGNFSLLFMMGLAMCGFLVAVISRQLQTSAYFHFYRVLSILFFLMVAAMYYFMASLDGFTYFLICLLSVIALVAAIMPFIFQGISVEKITLYSLYMLFVVISAALLWVNGFIIPRQKTVGFEKIYPFGVIFDKEGKYVYSFGDNRLWPESQDKTSFCIYRNTHPQQHLYEQALKTQEEMEAVNNPQKNKKDENDKNNDKSKTKDKKKKEVKKEIPPDFIQEAQTFSWSQDRAGERIAVASIKDKDGKNSVFTVSLSDFSRTEFIRDDEAEYYFPLKSHTFADYSTWSPDNKRFLVFKITSGGKTGVVVCDVANKSTASVDIENILSAFWSGDGRLAVVTGHRDNEKEPGSEGSPAMQSLAVTSGLFDFAASDLSFYSLDDGGNLIKTGDSAGPFEMVKVHPLSGKAVAFDGKKAMVFPGEQGGLSQYDLQLIPDGNWSAFSPDGRKIVCKTDGKVRLVDLETGTHQDIEETKDHVRHFTFSSDGKQLIYTSCTEGGPVTFHSVLKILDIAQNRLVQIVPQFTTGSYRASNNFPGSYPYSYFFDPHHRKLYFEEVVSRSGMGSSQTRVFLWMIYPPDIILEPSVLDVDEEDTESTAPSDPIGEESPGLQPDDNDESSPSARKEPPPESEAEPSAQVKNQSPEKMVPDSGESQ